jgi:broad specificity phosphatase PhoE
MSTVWFVTHPAVVIDPAVPVHEWLLSPEGRARMRAALGCAWTRRIGAIWSSTERKAMDAAAILAEGLGLGFSTHAPLGENDRSATGYLPRAEFEATADLFFAHPERSIRGWERAADAQRRIVAAVDAVLAASPAGEVAIVAHGAVGALLMAALESVPISRAHDQPAGSGGNLFAFDRTTRLLRHGWLPVDA